MKVNETTNLFAGIGFTLILGTLSHFFYAWTGENPFVGLFSPVNESVWEHLKLLFFPVLFYTLFEMIAFLKLDGHFLTVRLLALLTGCLLIPCLFFIYTGFLGKSLLIFDIAIFICSVLVTFFLSRYLELYAGSLTLPLFVLFTLLLFFLILFFSFTYSPPNLPLFQDPSDIFQSALQSSSDLQSS